MPVSPAPHLIREDDVGSLKLAGDGRESGCEVRADGTQYRHSRNGDQRGDEAIFNRSGPVLVLAKIDQGRKHCLGPSLANGPVQHARSLLPKD